MINLEEIFKKLENEKYCVVKTFKLDYKEGSDIDIFCYDLKSFSKKLLYVLNNLSINNINIKVIYKNDKHWYIDVLQDKKIDIRFDLYGDMPNYKKVLVKDCLFSSIIENCIVNEINSIKIKQPCLIDDVILRYLEYIENYELRPDKIKHLDYIVSKIENNEKLKKEFLNKLHFYTKLPEVLEAQKRKNYLAILKEIISKIKQTPIKELPKKIMKNIRR